MNNDEIIKLQDRIDHLQSLNSRYPEPEMEDRIAMLLNRLKSLKAQSSAYEKEAAESWENPDQNQLKKDYDYAN